MVPQGNNPSFVSLVQEEVNGRKAKKWLMSRQPFPRLAVTASAHELTHNARKGRPNEQRLAGARNGHTFREKFLAAAMTVEGPIRTFHRVRVIDSVTFLEHFSKFIRPETIHVETNVTTDAS
ncbi:hypothetical protein Ddc_17556 [Ditylenchus destructor]|nr:hypothetical protein Ddc_17556 [Ditylenchus destructor]